MAENNLIDDEFVATVRRDMLKFAQLQLRHADQAEDAVQEALVAALTGARSFSGRSALKTWVFGILRNKIIDVIRQQKRSINFSALSADEEQLDDDFDKLFKANAHWRPESRPGSWGDPEETLREQQFWEVFDVCLHHLPENTSRVFMMREFLELDAAEVCRELGISASNCNVILHRARNALRRCLQNGWFSAGEKPC